MAAGEPLVDVATQLFLDGAWHDARSSRTFIVESPSTGAALCAVQSADADDAALALDAAQDAFEVWRAAAPTARAGVLKAAATRVRAQAGEMAQLIHLETGKSLEEARGEIAYSAGYLEWYGEEAVRVFGRFGDLGDAGAWAFTSLRPVGPCLFITPWNFPLAMAARKLAPALAVGCSAIVKPAEQTPLAALALAAIFDEAGLPAGVLNVLPTDRPAAVVEPLLADGRIRKLSFTGSTAVGRLLLAQAADQVVRCSMELGGNAPFLVFEDADVEAAADAALIAKMRNVGQACTAANRFYVHEAIADQFADALVKRMRAQRLTVDVGIERGVGPLIDARQRARVEALVADAVARGATVRCGGRAVDGPGSFFEPTVLTEVDDASAVLHEEIFGPVAPIATFSTESEAITHANASEHGLVAYVFTTDLTRALRMVEALDTGMVAINRGLVSDVSAPFGGTKASGYGREGGPEGLQEYLEPRYAVIDRGAAVSQA